MNTDNNVEMKERYLQKALETLIPEIPDYLLVEQGTLIFDPEELI